MDKIGGSNSDDAGAKELQQFVEMNGLVDADLYNMPHETQDKEIRPYADAHHPHRHKAATGAIWTSRLDRCDELEALFDVGSDADMEDGEEDEEISSSRRDDPSVGSCRPREDDSDASSSKRSRSGNDIPLADTRPLSRPRSGGDSTPFGVVVSRTAPVRDPWMPYPSEI
ncbi:unnamed protein product [Phytophthora fragariaefolia]|uniref:Unnamed protein product n=1 Tax=Phytophthora fragariaefolia TaxID=1490495 RepID=A0A9W6WSJ1_9STRA|nr:unnamed protein product [Phytophthora fragariaefolia]